MNWLVRTGSLLGFAMVISLFAGCPPRPVPPVDAIGMSKTSINFEISNSAEPLELWNTNSSFASLTIHIAASDPWIQTDLGNVTSDRPVGSTLDRQTIQVSINRSLLPEAEAGTVHEGKLTFTAAGVITRTLSVLVTNDGTHPNETLRIINPVLTYAEPFLVDMHFSLKDAQGHSVIAEPTQILLSAQEGSTPVDALGNGLQIKRAAARQLKAHLVLDYSINMQTVEGAIGAMEDAAINILLPALNEDAQVGVWEFHRDDVAPQQVAPFTVARDFLRDQIQGIQQNVVHGFFSGSRIWDALAAAALDFSTGNPQKESRYIILFSNGNDTSSTATVNDVVSLAKDRGIRIYAVAFGNAVNVAALQDLTARTEGQYFPTQSISQVNDVFQEIVRDLDGQYNVRWASLKRGSNSFVPSILLSVNNDSVTFNAPQAFTPNQFAGDPLRGVLRLEASSDLQSTTVFLRAVYVPRFISQLHLRVHATQPFTVQQVGPADDGLTAGWTMVTEPDTETGGIVIHLEEPADESLQFATFGPILRFHFNTLAETPEALFDLVEVDNSVYPNLQHFVVEGFSG